MRIAGLVRALPEPAMKPREALRGKAVTLQWRRAVDPNQVMTEGDWI